MKLAIANKAYVSYADAFVTCGGRFPGELQDSKSLAIIHNDRENDVLP